LNKALFLDRDGIINVDKGYVYKWEDIIWYKEIFEIIKIANQNNYKVIVLTNQSGIFRNKYTHEDVKVLHDLMDSHLKCQGAIIDAWYYCADMDTNRRKPGPGMILEAQKDFNIDFSHSFMVGDKVSDIFNIQEGSPKPKTILVQGNYDLSLTGPETMKVSNHQELFEYLQKHLC